MFTSIPLTETIDYIVDQIYIHKKLPEICNKLIFKRLLTKITTENTFTFNDILYKQIDGCTMGGPLSVILSDIHMIKMENDVVIPFNPTFYKRYVDDIITKRKINKVDSLYHKLNSYHRKIKLTIEENPSKFLDTHIIKHKSSFTTQVYRKETKLPIHWSSCVPKRYKRNTINGDLHRSKRIATDMQIEIKAIKKKYALADYPPRFVNSVIKDFNTKSNKPDNSMIIPPNLFEEPKQKLFVELPYCSLNEKAVKQFIKKFHVFTNDNFILCVVWKTRNIRSLFRLKDNNKHLASVIYQGTCSCNQTYIGETIRNAEVRFSEHNNPLNDSEPARHIRNNIEHSFTWLILSKAPKNTKTRKNLESSFITLLQGGQRLEKPGKTLKSLELVTGLKNLEKHGFSLKTLKKQEIDSKNLEIKNLIK